MMNFFQEAILCQALSHLQKGFEVVRPLLPERIAKIEQQSEQVASPHAEALRHMAKAEKIILFCAKELAELDASMSQEVKKCLASGPVQVAKEKGT